MAAQHALGIGVVLGITTAPQDERGLNNIAGIVGLAPATERGSVLGSPNPYSQPTHGLQGFLIEIAFVNSLNLMLNSGTHADTVHDHQMSQFFPVNQNDALWTPCHIVLGGARES